MVCDWCERTAGTNSRFDGVCVKCAELYIEKRDFKSKRDDLPADNTSEEELWALVNLQKHDAQAIMDARIERMSNEINDNWTDSQRDRRLTQKKSRASVSLIPGRWQIMKSELTIY